MPRCRWPASSRRWRGQLADKYFNTEWILAVAHLVAAVLMFVAVRQKSFTGLFVTMLGWSVCYAATMPLVNAVLFRYVSDGVIQGEVFIWAPVAWRWSAIASAPGA